jgi:hypothetical protein
MILPPAMPAHLLGSDIAPSGIANMAPLSSCAQRRSPRSKEIVDDIDTNSDDHVFNAAKYMWIGAGSLRRSAYQRIDIYALGGVTLRRLFAPPFHPA